MVLGRAANTPPRNIGSIMPIIYCFDTDMKVWRIIEKDEVLSSRNSYDGYDGLSRHALRIVTIHFPLLKHKR